jgi:hypothetical protein
VVLVPADVDALRKIVAGIELMRNWPIGKLALGVEHPKLPARRIDDLVGVIRADRQVREQQHRVAHRRTVQNPHLGFQISLCRPQCVPHRPAHPLSRLQFAHPDRLAAVGVFLGLVLHRKKGAGAVMKRDVPLYAAGDPRADQSDQRRLDHVLPVDEVVSVSHSGAKALRFTALIGAAEAAPFQSKCNLHLYPANN